MEATDCVHQQKSRSECISISWKTDTKLYETKIHWLPYVSLSRSSDRQAKAWLSIECEKVCDASDKNRVGNHYCLDWMSDMSFFCKRINQMQQRKMATNRCLSLAQFITCGSASPMCSRTYVKAFPLERFVQSDPSWETSVRQNKTSQDDISLISGLKLNLNCWIMIMTSSVDGAGADQYGTKWLGSLGAD